MADQTIRAATSADEEAIAAIDVATWSPIVAPTDGPNPAGPFSGRRPEDHLVAEVDAAVVGYVALGHPTPLPSNRHVVQIQGLGVHPDHQGRGLGAALVDAALSEARRRGARKVSLRVMGGNVAAQRLYARAGFAVEGRLVGEFLIGGVLVDDILLARTM